MTPFPGNAMHPAVDLTAKHEATADPRTQNDPEDARGPSASPIGRLGQGKAVGVIRQMHGAPQAPGKVRAEGPVV